MSDENNNNNGTGDGQAPDPVKNMQAEFYRKTDKLASEQAQLNSKLDQIAQMLNQRSQPAQQQSSVEDEDAVLEQLAYKDPRAYAKRVKEMATQQASIEARNIIQQQTQANSVISQLGSEYPELADSNSDLTKRAVEIYKQLSPAEQQMASAYKIAVRDAAAELGVLPKAKRRSQEDFSFNGSSGSSNPGSRSNGSQKEDVSNQTLAFAEAVGLDIKDKKVVERLKQRSQRKNWGRYE